MLPVSLELRTIVTWVDLIYRIGLFRGSTRHEKEGSNIPDSVVLFQMRPSRKQVTKT